MSSFSAWILASRPKTLPAAASPVLIGTALAWTAGGFHGWAALAALLGALLIQIATNLTNDYADFLKGADTEDRKGPTRVTQAGILSAGAVRNGAAVTFGLAFLVGMFLVYRSGWPILIVGILSILCGVWYTVGRYSLAYTGLADLFVLVFFGPVAVGGTYFVQALNLPVWVLVAGLAPGLLSVAILTVNNSRDINEDRVAGKKTLIVRFGRSFGNALYAGTVVVAASIPGILVLWLGYGYLALVACGIVIPGIGMIRFLTSSEGVTLNPLLGKTAKLLFIYSLLFSIGWII